MNLIIDREVFSILDHVSASRYPTTLQQRSLRERSRNVSSSQVSLSAGWVHRSTASGTRTACASAGATARYRAFPTPVHRHLHASFVVENRKLF